MTFRPSPFLLLPIVLLTAAGTARGQTILPELRAPVEVVRDVDGIPHITAQNEHDLILMQGWVHAEDRLFQMDVARRQASGTLAELLGGAALESDVELRTLGFRRAAERSLDALSQESRDALEAYAAGVNAFIAANPLPPEYGLLELTTFEPWSPVDSLAVGKLVSAGLSFDLDDIERSETLAAYVAAGLATGFDGTALFFEDTHRSAPFDPATTVPDATLQATAKATAATPTVSGPWDLGPSSRLRALRPKAQALGSRYLEKLRRLPWLRDAIKRPEDARGSNEWAVSGARTVSGRPLIANDPHLALGAPSTFHQIHLQAEPAGFDVIGSGFAGSPFLVVGQNRNIAWGATVNPMDVTDVFLEVILRDFRSPSGLSILHRRRLEPIIPLPQVFRVNGIGDGIPDNVEPVPPGAGVPEAVLTVPRRNNGPIIEMTDGFLRLGLSVQYSGFSGTREIDAFRSWNLASDLDDFVAGLQSFDVGSQNWAYADEAGNIAYFTSAEMPVREDLQDGSLRGLPPFFIRNGLGGNEWLPVRNPQPGQALPFEILPFAEMPQLVNPPADFFVNANNDPAGIVADNDPLNQLRPDGGIFYLSPGYDPGNRAGRIKQLLEERLAEGGLVSAQDMMAIQADVVMRDAQVFTPIILQAFSNAQATGAHPALTAFAGNTQVAEAAARLGAWDYSTPTGIFEGYDASDFDGELEVPNPEEVANSIAATLYSVWRSQIVKNTIDRVLDGLDLPRPGSRLTISALRNLFDSFPLRGGVGASGLNFFVVTGVADAKTRRDIVVLQSLADALELLTGADFQAAFGGSSVQEDYRWGLLHRLVLEHPLNSLFNIPPAGGAFPPPLGGLPGIPVDGGFETVDAARHSIRAADDDDFMFDSGPARRYVGEVLASPGGIAGESSLPGGESGVLGSPLYTNLLGRWLTNETHPLRQDAADIAANTVLRLLFVPPVGGQTVLQGQ